MSNQQILDNTVVQIVLRSGQSFVVFGTQKGMTAAVESQDPDLLPIDFMPVLAVSGQGDTWSILELSVRKSEVIIVGQEQPAPDMEKFAFFAPPRKRGGGGGGSGHGAAPTKHNRPRIDKPHFDDNTVHTDA